MSLRRPSAPLRRSVALCLATACIFSPAYAQSPARVPVGTMGPQGNPPLIKGGGGLEATFARLDFDTKLLESQEKNYQINKQQQQQMVDSGVVSLLDLQAPSKAVNEFNKAGELMRKNHVEQAAKHLEESINIYPAFVSAHNNLGVAYLTLKQSDHAKAEFETATKLDPRFPRSFLNLGKMALAQEDYPTALADLQSAADLLPSDVTVLTLLAYAEQAVHQYRQAISTAERVHTMDHKQMANVHYIAAAAALALEDYPTAQRELAFFVQEDPGNVLAPVARHDLEVLSHPPAATATVDPH
jgi:tetratricopeptide (TPR) repeat protein